MPRRASRYKQTLKRKSATANQPVQDLNEILPPSAEEFRALYKLARYIQQNEPWDYMEETDVFGVKDPVTGDLGFVSVMGALGEYKAVAVYRGVEGLYGWRKFEEYLVVQPESEQAHDMLMEIPQLQLSFVPASFVEAHDRTAIKNSGARFPDDVPLFRSYWPGYYPWFLTSGEARHLTHVLTQTIQVAKQSFYDQSVIPLNEDPEDRDYLIRVPKLTDGVVRWHSSIERIDEPNIPLVPIDVDDAVVDQLKAMPKSDPQEIDMFTLPAKLGEANERPRVLYMLLVTNSLTGFLYGFEPMEACDGVDLMYADLAEKVAKMWLQHEVVPTELRARSLRLLNMFQYLAGEVGFRLSLTKELPAVDEAKGFILEKMNM